MNDNLVSELNSAKADGTLPRPLPGANIRGWAMYARRDAKGFYTMRQERFRHLLQSRQEHPWDVCATATSIEQLHTMCDNIFPDADYSEVNSMSDTPVTRTLDSSSGIENADTGQVPQQASSPGSEAEPQPPEGFVFCSMMQGTHHVDRYGQVAPYTVPLNGPHRLPTIADAAIRLGLRACHKVGHPRFPEPAGTGANASSPTTAESPTETGRTK